MGECKKLLGILGMAFVVGCTQPRADWRVSGEGVRFEWQKISLYMPAHQPYIELLLRHEQGGLIQRVPWIAAMNGWIVFDYPWEPDQRLQVWGRKTGQGLFATPVFLGDITTPKMPLQVVDSRLQITAGTPALNPNLPLWLPAGRQINLALALVLQQPQPQTLRVEITATPRGFLRWHTTSLTRQLPKSAAHASQQKVQSLQRAPVLHSQAIALRVPGQRAYVQIPFWFTRAQQNPAMLPSKPLPNTHPTPQQKVKKGWIAWRVLNAAGAVLSHGKQDIHAIPLQHLQTALLLQENRFPVPPEFGQKLGVRATGVLRHKTGQIVLPPIWLTPLKRWLPGVQPSALVGVSVVNHSPSLLPLAFTMRMVDQAHPPQKDVLGFGTQNAEPKPVLQVLAPKQTGRIVLPLDWHENSLTPGRYWRCVDVFFWGLQTPLKTDCRPLKVVKTGTATWLLVLIALGCLVFALGFLRRLSRWLGRLALWEVALLALIFAITLLTVSLPGVLVSAVTTLLLGPFGFLLDGLVYKLGVFAWAAALMGCLRHTGVFFLFFLLWQMAQTALHGIFSPLLLLSAAVAACLGEMAFWLGGASRPNFAGGMERKVLRPLPNALYIAAGEGLAIGFYLVLAQSWQRLHLAPWFVLLQAVSGGLWAGLGAWLGLRAALAQKALIPAASSPLTTFTPQTPQVSDPVRPPNLPSFQNEVRVRHSPTAQQTIHNHGAKVLQSLSIQLPPLGLNPQTGELCPIVQPPPKTVCAKSIAFKPTSDPAANVASTNDVRAKEAPQLSLPFWPQKMNIRFKAGQIALILGESGSGKSTFLRLLKGLEPLPQGAELQLHWQNQGIPQKQTQVVRPFLYLSQHIEWQAVLENVEQDVSLGAWIGSQQHTLAQAGRELCNGAGRVGKSTELPPPPAPHAFEAWQQTAFASLEELGLTHLRGRALHRLSGGELQRALLAALYAQAVHQGAAQSNATPKCRINSQSIWLLDEPFAHQDSEGRRYITAMLEHIVEQQGLVVLVEHRLANLEALPIHAWQFTSRGHLQAISHPSTLWERKKGQIRQNASKKPPGVKNAPHVSSSTQTGILRLQGVSVNSLAAAFKVAASHNPDKQAPNFGLRNVQFSLHPNQKILLQGPNGTGKTLLISAMAGFIAPSEGSIVWQHAKQQTALASMGVRQKRALIGLAPQRPAASIFSPTTLEAILAPLTAIGYGETEAHYHAKHWLKCLGLRAQANTHPQQLSAGELRRLAIGRVLAQAPLVLLLDEPFAGLDAKNAHNIMELIQNYLDQNPQHRLLLSTHEDSTGILNTLTQYTRIQTNSFF